MPDSKIITRFAPSPTGYLHVGGARTALFNWLLARHAGGEFLLRIEDTDLARSTEQAKNQLLEDLQWLGLHWDNPQPIHQSHRKEIYDSIINDLISRGLAYKAYETPAELDAMRKEAEKQKRTFIYRRPSLTDEQIRNFESERRPSVVRFAMPVQEYAFNDVVLGKSVTLAAGQVQDFVIRKTDGMPTYHFAVVIDDAEMNITHILRGQEHLLNTINHIALQQALSYPRPTYGHLPIIMNIDGTKMGKRDRDKMIRQRAQVWMKTFKKSADDLSSACGIDSVRLSTWLSDSTKQLDLPEQSALMHTINLRESDLPEILVHDFRKNGYLPETLLNFLSLLGWNPGGDRERMSIDELIHLFTMEEIGKSNAKFDRGKLLAFNTEASAAAPVSRLVPAMRSYLAVNPDSPLNKASDDDLAKLIEMKRGIRTLRELDEATRFFFIADDQLQYDPSAMEKVMKKNDGLTVLQNIQILLKGLSDWSPDALEHLVNTYCQEKGLALGKVAQPIRLAISGGTISPPIFQSLAFMGSHRTLLRIDRCIQQIN
ncbi:MAG TPA: glutamate--tRNA ligase [Tepidisphaeraceae bacterium]|nr:glutamate--tRNA ligase [Tepidisphaeraceae bacterium]